MSTRSCPYIIATTAVFEECEGLTINFRFANTRAFCIFKVECKWGSELGSQFDLNITNVCQSTRVWAPFPLRVPRSTKRLKRSTSADTGMFIRLISSSNACNSHRWPIHPKCHTGALHSDQGYDLTVNLKKCTLGGVTNARYTFCQHRKLRESSNTRDT